MNSLTARSAHVTVSTPMPPPEWALLERELIRAQTTASLAFFDRYFDERGYLKAVPHWSADDGADDAAENLCMWPVLYALGAPDDVLKIYRNGWEGHLRQYTEARTTDVPFARDGMYYREFPVMFDWAHNGEGFSAFFLEGLADPYDAEFVRRTRRFAGMYMDEDPIAKNYDPKHRVVRSVMNGSRGPMLRKTTALDWAGDRFEVEGRFRPAHGERSYEQVLEHFEGYNDVIGDHPLNLGATTLAVNAYMATGEAKYRDWVLEYVDAWVERTESNGGIIPSNIGLDGTIGGAADGKWYGGVYGWNFTRKMPPTGELRHRPYFHSRAPWGFANALLLTGDQRYVDVWRGVIDGVNANSKMVAGQTMYPRMYGDEGWYAYGPERFDKGALDIYCWSGDRADLERVPEDRWVSFLEGRDPRWPVAAMREDLEVVRAKIEGVRKDMMTPDTRLSDDPNSLIATNTDTLVQVAMGGAPLGRRGFPLHCRLRYFDPGRRRPGLPEDVAALVEGFTADETTVSLVNLDQVKGKTVVVQAGAYGEHRVVGVALGSRTIPIEDSSFAVHLAPGCGARLVIAVDRYANQPTFAFPWV